MLPQQGSQRTKVPIVGLTLLVAANVILTAVCSAPPKGAWRDGIFVAGELLLATQVLQLALWTAWSDLRAPLRWLIAAAVYSLLILTVDRYATWVSSRGVGSYLEIGIMGGLVLLGVHALVLPLRWLCGWRLSFRDISTSESRRGQFTLQHWFAWCGAIVLPLAVLAARPSEAASGLLMLIVLLLFVAPLLASALLAAFSRRWWLWSLVAVGWTCPVGWLITEIYWQYLLSKGEGFGGRHEMILLFWLGTPSGLTGAMIVNLLALRALGMRWVSVAESKATASLPHFTDGRGS